MLEVHLYGELRRYAANLRPDADAGTGESVVLLEPQAGETVRTALERLGVPLAGVCHVFLNGRLLSTRNGMAPWLGYQEAHGGAAGPRQELDTPLRPGDRLGLFAHDMALLVV
jgi:hypothetical protein